MADGSLNKIKLADVNNILIGGNQLNCNQKYKIIIKTKTKKFKAVIYNNFNFCFCCSGIFIRPKICAVCLQAAPDAFF